MACLSSCRLDAVTWILISLSQYPLTVWFHLIVRVRSTNSSNHSDVYLWVVIDTLAKTQTPLMSLNVGLCGQCSSSKASQSWPLHQRLFSFNSDTDVLRVVRSAGLHVPETQHLWASTGRTSQTLLTTKTPPKLGPFSTQERATMESDHKWRAWCNNLISPRNVILRKTPSKLSAKYWLYFS